MPSCRPKSMTRLLRNVAWIAALVLSWPFSAGEARTAEVPLVFRGTCDASAAAGLGTNWFAIGSDEDPVIRVYHAARPGPPVSTLDLGTFLELGRKRREPDIEGAAALGDRVYWITSHARDQDGVVRQERHRLFATRVTWESGQPRLTSVGRPYRQLIADLSRAPQLRQLDLARAAERDPEETGGLNIEGLAAGPGGRLLIGFRNPIPGGRALVVPIENPAEVLEGKAARLGEARLLDLGGLGIRDLTWSGERYWIVAGSHRGGGKTRLYVWAGEGAAPVWMRGHSLKGLNPESLVWDASWAGGRLLVGSDDGNREIEGVRCKDLENHSARSFRAIWLDVGPRP